MTKLDQALAEWHRRLQNIEEIFEKMRADGITMRPAKLQCPCGIHYTRCAYHHDMWQTETLTPEKS